MGTLLLHVLDAGDEECRQVVTPDSFPLTIGREPESGLVLPHKSVSRHHCTLENEGGVVWVLDHDSSNGTFLNGVPVHEERVSSGDVLRVGNLEILVIDIDEERHRGGASTLKSVKDENRYLWKVLRLNREILSEFDRKALLETILDTAIGLMRAERGFLILYKGRGISFEAARNHHREDVDRPRDAISQSIVHQVREDGQYILTTDAVQDPRFEKEHSIQNLMLRSVLCVPLKGEKAPIGALYIDNRIQRGAFTDQNARLLFGFADQAAMAIVHADLLDDASRREKELKRSRDEIKKLNKSLEQKVKQQTVKLAQAHDDLRRTRQQLQFKYNYQNIIGQSESMQQLFSLLDKIIDSQVPVLVRGESGTGKELIARVIHFNGPRREMPFVSENCAAISPTLLESELFGHEKGAFTGADQRAKGLFEQAHGGTLFLDEVGDMSTDMQKRLLRVLQEGEIRRVGGDRVEKIDVRLLSATNRDLESLKGSGEFREDLYYRLNVVQVVLPPLRERREDIPLLIDHFLRTLAEEAGHDRPAMRPEVIERLHDYDWPGNVRELENEVRKAIALSDGEIGLEHLSRRVRGEGGSDMAALPAGATRPTGTLKSMVERMEVDVIERTLAECGWNKSRAAERLGLSRPGLRKKLARYGIGPDPAAAGGGESDGESPGGSDSGGGESEPESRAS